MKIISKIAPLEVSIKRMQNSLDSIDVDIIYNKLVNPAKNIYWINIQYKQAPNYIYSNGKGSSPLATKASALGEFIERLSTNNYFNDFFLGDRTFFYDQKEFDINSYVLPDRLEEIYNLDGELENINLIDFNSSRVDKIISLPFKSDITNEVVEFPYAILQNLYASNGMAAGNSVVEAKVQALSEIFERFVKIESIKKSYSLPQIPNDIIDEFSYIKDGIDTLKEKGYIIKLLDASLGGVFPVVAISLINQKSGSMILSFGSHPILEVALQRALNELLQGRDIKGFSDISRVTFDDSDVVNELNIESHFIDSNGIIGAKSLNKNRDFEYCLWDYNGKSIDDEYNFLVNILKSIDKDLFVREYSYLGFDSVQIIVPNFSEIYPIDDLIFNNINRGKFVRDRILNFKTLSENEIELLIEDLDEFENIDVGKLIGVIFKDSFTLDEFRAQLYLMLGAYKEVYEILKDSSDKIKYIISQLAFMVYEELEWSDYEDSLIELYGENDLRKAANIFNLKSFFIDMDFSSEYINILNLYDSLDKKKRIV